ncbi:hypothetical protein GOP47_0019705 [Adiantum capillus-veneris]|uniref:Wall-associated receptor kinase galacturonan-binding domain-containing protein n=1 Tax=Adiantum capillus-veneris TaxID=13818 RepID=A0A9D4UBZ9_ADICA|nr:hypothetical protein GOP47_0019705 [Adiantum capillus-veneris]
MPPLSLLATFLLLISLSTIQAWDCESSCGGITLNSPFGSASGCGSSAFQPYVNCSNGKLLFYSPTGTYQVQSIDYSNNVMVVIDPQMSTCSSMQLSGAFGLPIGAPFSFSSYNKVVLIGCSSTSSLYSKQSCDTSSEAQQLCKSIYENCDGISQIGIVATSSTGSASSCCVYASSLLATAPYEVDLPLLQCSTYTSVYHIGNIQSPQSSWLYGIALQYNPSSSSQSSPSGSGQNPSCYVCQEAEDSHGSLALPSRVAGLLLVLAAIISLPML